MKILNRLFTDMKVDSTIAPQINKQTTSTKEVTKYTREDEKINALFKKNNQPLTKEALKVVKMFISKADGSLESKLETIDASLSKGIEITHDNLSAVHEALIGDVEDVVKQVAARPMNLKKIYASLPKEIKELVDSKVAEGAEFDKAVAEVLKDALKEIFSTRDSSINLNPETEDIDVVKIFVEAKEAYLSKVSTVNTDGETAITDNVESDVVEDDIVMTPVNAEDTVSGTENTEVRAADIVSESEIPDIEKDLETLEFIEKSLESIEEDIEKIFEKVDGNINVSELVEFKSENDFKKVIRTEITEKMVELKQEFNNYKKAITKQLDSFINDKPVVLNMKETLNSVIDKLDNILMKSEITMHTDMKTERDLLASSSKLDDARVLLDKNDSKAAIEIVKEIKALIDNINFKPSEQKIFGVSQKMFFDKLYEENIIRSIPVNINTDPQVSPRAVLELLRGMGLNHEAEVSELINKEKSEDGIKYTQNMKTILMKLEEDVTQRVSAREGLENLTGQQLMNKLEYKSQKQKLLFNMPIEIDNDIKNLKIHVNAKKDNQKIDWKNSTLYFVVQLDNLGDTGILVDINNGQVNLTVKNDSPDIEEKIKPYLKPAFERLESIGLNHFNLSFDSLNTKEKEIKQPIKELKKEGFDFKI